MSPRPDIRRAAFDKLASLATKFPRQCDGGKQDQDVERLRNECYRPTSMSQQGSGGGLFDGMFKGRVPAPRPMRIREADILLALCKAVPSVSLLDHAATLVSEFASYLPDACGLPLSPHIQLNTESSPWEALTYHLAVALLSLGSRYPSLQKQVSRSISAYVEHCLEITKSLSTLQSNGETAVDPDDFTELSKVACLAVSLTGFLEAASTHASFWSAAEQLDLIKKLRLLLSEKFLILVETVSSTIRNSESTDPWFQDWRGYTKRYAIEGRPLGAMLLQRGFMQFIKSCTSPANSNGEPVPEDSLLDQYIHGTGFGIGALKQSHDSQIALVKYMVEIILDQVQLLDDGADYLQLGSVWQQRLAFSAKAYALVGFLNCVILDEGGTDTDILFHWLEETLANPDQMASKDLATITLKTMVVLARLSPLGAPNITRSLLRAIVQNGLSSDIISIATSSLAETLRLLSQDTVIGTLYSLGNVLSSGPTSEKPQRPESLLNGGHPRNLAPHSQEFHGSLISLTLNNEEESSITYRNVIHAIMMIAASSNDGKIVALAQSILLQKIGKINATVDAYIVQETAALALSSDIAEFQLLLKFYSRLYQDALAQNKDVILDAVYKARNHLANNVDRRSRLYKCYLLHLLESIINTGDSTGREKDLELSADDIIPLLRPLALLFSKNTDSGDLIEADDIDMPLLLRDVWFNIAAHGISLCSGAIEHQRELTMLAMHSPPLVAAELLESDIELNTVLRRGIHHHHQVNRKKCLLAELPDLESDVKRLSYPQLTFLNAALLLESLRADSGDCTKVLTYFLDPALRTSDMGNCMTAIADRVVSKYLEKSISGFSAKFSAPGIAEQLANMLVGCCHRIEKVQQVAASNVNRIISRCPSSLCQKWSLFVLLDLLTVMWSSCLDEELDEFDWKSTYTSTSGRVEIQLSDNYEFRNYTLSNFYKSARMWVATVMNIAPLDIKGLLQTYLSDCEDIDAYGRVSLGRTFAIDMGSAIPSSDQRLGSIDNPANAVLNVASDFISQYTARQQYRFSDAACRERKRLQRADGQVTWNGSVSQADASQIDDAPSVITDLESCGPTTPLDETRHALQRAATLLCRGSSSYASIISHLVNIPFQIFTTESIEMGISFWVGVINENPRTESRILMEVGRAWERTVHRHQGIFDASFKSADPFMLKTEFLPSDKASIEKRQKKAQNKIRPHFQVLQFFESHFNATRLGSVHTQRIFRRLVTTTLIGLTNTAGHPLAREVHFHIILFALKVLRYCESQSNAALWKLKDQILSAALSWFAQPPRWSFGGDRLQVKAEDKVLQDVEIMLQSTQVIGTTAFESRKSLQQKQSLLQALIEHERSRLRVWLFPLEQERRHILSSGSVSKATTETISGSLRLAWTENPSLAMQLAERFPSSKLRNDVRWLLLNFPEKALVNPESLEIIFGPSLPQDVSFQLKYLLYWDAVNPMAAVMYFLPAYGNHPFVLQYAMRALESHSVDISFFYVPQLVQALRYDALGYVERYILETAQLSQLFAHQVIWNMKANAFKDENAQIPDPVKPVLDRFMGSLIGSFSDDEREFYEREFSFFNEITDVSGKLRPYIKKSKPEKKQKIEEELRKIKVEVGVYLPSNPDGVVVGIDRKSGKPLQSHAKAPYMATFRIKKEKQAEENGNGLERKSPANGVSHSEENSLQRRDGRGMSSDNSYEVWQSAIFKVGDDCRQDLLALQMIAAFRGIFESVGLDVFVYPYRVTATAPGCGVIDVLPNSISRDMLGREAVNGLYDYFVSKYGSEDSISFQKARSNFVKSMAAYSVISYLLQFKDRHNGNIMIDDAGHILHIDFGFCFDIAPGGVRFERAPFKLTSEMVAVMGGGHTSHGGANQSSANLSVSKPGSNYSTGSQAYKLFESLVIKAFLASRPYSTKLGHIITLMLDSGLPCFKADTLKNFHDRFVLDKNEREAADFMRGLIQKSYMNVSTKGYDQFQLLTNNIPY